jgi:hypothetical protein
MSLRRRTIVALAWALLLIAGCGGSSTDQDPVAQVPASDGLRERVAEAQAVRREEFPATEGKTLAELASEAGARDGEAVLASSVFVTGRRNRIAFGSIDQDGQFAYGKTAVYIAREPDAKAKGPYPAPADLLVTEPAFRSKQAATEADPFAAVYAAEVPLERAGTHTILTVTRQGEGWVAATGQIKVLTPARDPVPDIGEKAPAAQTDTAAGAAGNLGLIDTREPPSDLHERSFADLVGSDPVVLLFATPQLCQSRVCGPVVDVALQVRRELGDQVEFIHQEVYVDNDPQKGLREPLRRFHLPTEPWLFAVDRTGEITARLEGSFGLAAVEAAARSAL